ncbi:hypothetical protein F4802DRAFT_594145 [Xylaria palmicola]|nr:hypothetical protein F4802DRAFT_594145 [Xylaria palmicola]
MYTPEIHGRGSVSPGPRSEVPGTEQRRQQQQQQQVFPVSHVTTYPPSDPIQRAQRNPILAWILNTVSIALFPHAGPSSLGKRSAGPSPNTLTSVVAGVLVTVFVLFAGVFLYVYRRSIRFRKNARKRRRHRHGRRASGNSKISQGSDVAGGGGDGAGDGGAAAADAGAEA